MLNIKLLKQITKCIIKRKSLPPNSQYISAKPLSKCTATAQLQSAHIIAFS